MISATARQRRAGGLAHCLRGRVHPRGLCAKVLVDAVAFEVGQTWQIPATPERAPQPLCAAVGGAFDAIVGSERGGVRFGAGAGRGGCLGAEAFGFGVQSLQRVAIRCLDCIGVASGGRGDSAGECRVVTAPNPAAPRTAELRAQVSGEPSRCRAGVLADACHGGVEVGEAPARRGGLGVGRRLHGLQAGSRVGERALAGRRAAPSGSDAPRE